MAYLKHILRIYVKFLSLKEVWGNSVYPHIKKIYLIVLTVFWFQEQEKGKNSQSCLEIPWESD